VTGISKPALRGGLQPQNHSNRAENRKRVQAMAEKCTVDENKVKVARVGSEKLGV
jgi:hypothetical protein